MGYSCVQYIAYILWEALFLWVNKMKPGGAWHFYLGSFLTQILEKRVLGFFYLFFYSPEILLELW